MRTAELRDRLIARLSPERARLELDRLGELSERGPLRTIKASVRGFQHNNDLLWASALTYTSGLSIVPILAIGLSAIKGLGGLDRIRPLIEHYLAANSPQITDQILNFVGNVSAKALGEVGGAVLLVTVVLTLGTIENAFNTIFNAARGRTLARKFSDYLSVTFTVPLLMVAAVAVKAELLRELPHLPGAALLVSGLMVWSGFFFLYVFFSQHESKLARRADRRARSLDVSAGRPMGLHPFPGRCRQLPGDLRCPRGRADSAHLDLHVVGDSALRCGTHCRRARNRSDL